MLNWLWKWFGYHVCEEFTQWEKRKMNLERACKPGDGNPYIAGQLTITFTEHWQERRCTLCGNIQQRRLDY